MPTNRNRNADKISGMPNLIDLTGRTFGRLRVTFRAETRGRVTVWGCHCSCGQFKEIRARDLVTGKTNSCGCLRRELLTKHGGIGSPEYRTWCLMKRRCYDASDRGFKNYGGRGITVCDKWKDDFSAFIKDVGPKPYPSATIERIDHNGGYEPGNVRWASMLEQGNNRRNNRIVRVGGKEMSLSMAARVHGVKRRALAHLIDYRRLSPDDALDHLVARGR